MASGRAEWLSPRTTMSTAGQRARALPQRFVDMRRLDPAALDPIRTLGTLPPLIKGYLRLGGFVRDGAVIGEQFNTTDVCIVVKTALVAAKYFRHYEHRLGAM
jgi:putative hemolysin